MKTKAVRLYGKEDLRLEEFELPEIKEDEILARVVSDSICICRFICRDEREISRPNREIILWKRQFKRVI